MRNLPLGGRTNLVIAALVGALSGAAAQQASPAALSFDAASVKPRPSPEGPIHFNVLPNRLDVGNMSLSFLIQQAYDLPPFELLGPDVALSRRYDVMATTGGVVSKADMRTMLQNLLIERFHLATHWEEKTEAIYHLTALPGGPKMKTAETGYAAPNSPTRSPNAMMLTGPMSMRQLAQSLTRFAGKPVLDVTGLEGYFVVKLTFAPDNYDASTDNGPAQPLLPSALEDQLGLKLVAVKEPVKTLVVDHADAVPVSN